VDILVARGCSCVTVLDISASALAKARARVGANTAARVSWVHADVTDPAWRIEPVDVWHDRALFHFLIDSNERRQYVQHLKATVKPGGAVVMATFAPDGPERCSGLPVARYSSRGLAEELGEEFRLLESIREDHRTPSGSTQAFQWSRFAREHVPR
jgi:hypothetical protein